jgi:predicted N-acetyltransferase YhbS
MDKEQKICKTTLQKRPEYLDKTLELIEEAFNYSEGHKFFSDFYPLMEPDNHKHNHILINEDGVVLGHIGVKIRSICFGGNNLNCALIGGVAINPKFRGKGFFKKLMNDVLDLYSKKVGLFILWSDQFDLYKKFQFYKAGAQIQTGMNDQLSPYLNGLFQKTKFKDLNDSELNQIIDIYENVTCHNYLSFKRTKSDWDSLKKIDSIDLYILETNEGKILSYFCQNKGHDLTYIIHELGYLSFYKKEIFNLLKEQKLWLPENELKNVSYQHMSYLGLFKIGNQTLLNNFLNTLSDQKLEINSINEEEVSISFNKENFSLQLPDFLTSFLGPNPIAEFKPFCRPLYLSGADSI